MKRSSKAAPPVAEEPEEVVEPTPVKVKGKAPPPVGPPRTVNLDRRSPAGTKKTSKAALQKWAGENRGKALDAIIAALGDQSRKKSGHYGTYIGHGAHQLVVAIPCNYLAFEFVTQNQGVLLGLIYQLVAKYGVGKSAFAAEVGRWFCEFGGGVYCNEAETKFNPQWYEAILRDHYERFTLNRCDSIEGWQEANTDTIQTLQRAMTGTTKEPGPGRSVPILGIVDSIMGKQCREIQEGIIGKKLEDGTQGITGKGHATRAHPLEAQIITKYMRTIPQVIDGWPFSLFLINHLRMKTDDMGNDVRTKTGGEQVNFQESFELELKKVGGQAKRIKAQDWEGIIVELSCQKNSFGTTGRKANVRLVWWYEDKPDGTWDLKVAWDWDWATVDLLDKLLNGRYNDEPMLRNNLKEAGFHIAATGGDIENSAWSKTLGMSEKSAVPWGELGAMIRENDEVMTTLRRALRIQPRPMLQSDYLEQLNAMTEEMP